MTDTVTPQPAPGTLADAIARAQRVPETHDFPTVDALLADFAGLAAAHPDLVRAQRIGTSRLGEPIHAYAIGSGSRDVIMVGGVHPNEPIGFRTLQHLARELVADDALRAAHDATWHLVPCIDPDGTRLNEGWFAAPGDRIAYARRFYRPAPDEQVEWSFPFAHKDAWFDRVMPETQALMRLIDATTPDLLVGLHNAELGGVYYYVTRPLEGIVDALHAIPAALDLPLDAGEPESPDLEALAQAVYRAPLSSEHYDYLESLGLDPSTEVGGGGSADYIARHGTFGLIAELPYWSHPDAVDASGSGRRYRDVIAEKSQALADLGAVLQSALDEAEPDLPVATPFLRASRAFVPAMAHIAASEAARLPLLDPEREATVAEVFSNADVVRMFQLRFGGILLRAIDAEVQAGTAPVRLRRVRERLAARYAAWCAAADAVEGLQPLPIASLVGVQVASTLAASSLLRDAAASTRAGATEALAAGVTA
ncbi:M14 family zinc carboxypeptidase [Agrococcus sp. SGAir0287]|uniref:M14 family zinc carboxypeptidase n=1 Tax=Agrococcus sp. SGAir0287 TaxID=2070347 RepID=UPI0010CCD2AC|nr:M14 family zinc carboxypeptidase [Agrococcus sp. SGAir0287]QCR18100.1 peptidase M14 [Agrococcus sp. SGAir0287]